jgi:hypothetical protein
MRSRISLTAFMSPSLAAATTDRTTSGTSSCINFSTSIVMRSLVPRHRQHHCGEIGLPALTGLYGDREGLEAAAVVVQSLFDRAVATSADKPVQMWYPFGRNLLPLAGKRLSHVKCPLLDSPLSLQHPGVALAARQGLSGLHP